MHLDLSTFALEILNFLVLLWILKRFVYRPLQARIQERRDAIEREGDRAREAHAAAEALQAKLAARETELDEIREATLARAREEAAAERARVLAQAREDARAEQIRARHVLERERRADLAQIGEAAIDSALELTGKLLGELASDAFHSALIERLTREVEARATELQSSLHPRDGAPLRAELRAARPLSERELARLCATLEAIAGPCEIVRSTDAELQAGAVLRVGDWVLDASTRGQLAFLREHAERAFLELPATPPTDRGPEPA